MKGPRPLLDRLPSGHRLVLFTGSGPGAGKSTLSAFLSRQLTLHGIPVRWLYEEDIVRMEGFAAYAEQWLAADPRAPDSLLQCARMLFADEYQTETTWVVDTQFPGFYWLLGKYPLARIREFGREMAEILLPMRLLVVYLDADVARAFARAVAYRGEAWGENIIPYAARWSLPCYPGGPIQDLDEVSRFEEWVREHHRILLAEWPGEVLTIDSTDVSLDAAKQMLLDRVGLTEATDEAATCQAGLEDFAGTYESADEKEVPRRLTISLVKGSLFVDAYWPAGTPLVPEAPGRFRLQSTSRMIEFERDENGAIRALVYTIPRLTHRYMRLKGGTQASR